MKPAKRIAVVGASGYAGQEVLRLLRAHPQLQVDLATTARRDHTPPPPPLPYDSVVAPLELDQLQYVDGVFLCAPPGAGAELAPTALEQGCAVVDLSADFRLRDPASYAATYGSEHPAPGLLEQAVYGLTERNRGQIAQARLIANPGCYPTSILLPLLPLLDAELLDEQANIVADAKSGVSGAGKAPTERTVYGTVHDNCAAYAVGTHRHAPEIAQHAGTDRIVFVPHLLPTFRGILTTLYLRPRAGTTATDLLGCLDEAYATEQFVRVYGHGLPELSRVQHTNFCDVGVAAAGDLVVVVAALDNLIKGAAGQALQNMNLMLGLPEREGLA